MAQSMTNFDAALKEYYLPPTRDQLNNGVMMLAQLERNSRDVEGRRAVLSLHTTRNAGIGSRAEGGTLPTAGQQGYVEERVPMYYHYGRIQFTGPIMRASKSDAGSFLRAADAETKGVLTDLRRDMNRQVYGTSNGVIATCGVTAGATTVVLDSDTSLVQMRQLEVGMVIDIGTVANPVSVATARTITSVDKANRTFDISGANVTTAATDFVFRTGNGGAIGGAGQKEITGLRTIVDSTGALFNVNPTTAPSWAAGEYANGGVLRAFTDNLLEVAIDNQRIESGYEEDYFVVTSHASARNFAAQMKAQRRYEGTRVELRGGYTGLGIDTPSGSATIIAERDCPESTAFGLALSALTLHEMSDWEFMDEDGAVLFRVSGQDAYEAVLFKYCELTTDHRNWHFKILDLSTS